MRRNGQPYAAAGLSPAASRLGSPKTVNVASAPTIATSTAAGRHLAEGNRPLG